MGGNSSKENIKEATEVDNSSGFHVLELHFPSTGGGILFLLILLTLASLIFCCCYFSRRQRVPPYYNYPPANPFLPQLQYPTLPFQQTSFLPWTQEGTPYRSSRIFEIPKDTDDEDKKEGKEGEETINKKCNHAWVK